MTMCRLLKPLLQAALLVRLENSLQHKRVPVRRQRQSPERPLNAADSSCSRFLCLSFTARYDDSCSSPVLSEPGTFQGKGDNLSVQGQDVRCRTTRLCETRCRQGASP